MLRCGHIMGEADITLGGGYYAEKMEAAAGLSGCPTGGRGVSAWLSRKGMKAFGTLHKPLLSPPA